MGLFASEIVQILQSGDANDRKNKSLCMMGKMDILLNAFDFPQIASKFDIPYDEEIFEQIKSQDKIDAYDFFAMLGFSDVHAVDYSPYEGADIVFDLTSDLPENLYHRFDYIIDGGTLEHTFDPAKSIKNMSNMVKQGGFIYHAVPGTGMVNHGFYSFSPDMLLEFYQANGFRVRDLRMEFRFAIDQQLFSVFSSDCRFLSIFKINQYIAQVSRIGNVRAIVRCLAEKIQEGDSKIYPLQGIFQSLYAKRLPSDWVDSVVDFLKESPTKRIALYGKSDECDKLINRLYETDIENRIECIFSGHSQKAGTSYRGYRVLYPTKKKLDAIDIIMITNQKHEDEILTLLSKFGKSVTDKVYTLSQISSKKIDS